VYELIWQSQQKGLDAALECIQREDPSLQVHTDPDTSETVLSGNGFGCTKLISVLFFIMKAPL
jgi:Elongation Factor G, domain III